VLRRLYHSGAKLQDEVALLKWSGPELALIDADDRARAAFWKSFLDGAAKRWAQYREQLRRDADVLKRRREELRRLGWTYSFWSGIRGNGFLSMIVASTFRRRYPALSADCCFS
jgi:hypothetical protein